MRNGALPTPGVSGGTQRRPAWPLHVVAPVVVGIVLWLVYGGGYVGLDGMWSLDWGRDLIHGDTLSASATTTPHVLSNLLGAVLAPFGADADHGLVAVEFLAAGGLVWVSACLALELGGPVAALGAGLLVGFREQLLYATTSAFLDVFVATFVVWAALLVVRRRDDRDAGGEGGSAWSRGAMSLLFVAGLLRPEPWLLAGCYWLWRVGVERRPAPAQLAGVFAAPAAWLFTDGVVNGDALFSVHSTDRVNAALRAGGLYKPDSFLERLVSAPRNVAHAAGPEIFALALVCALILLWPRLAGLARAAVPDDGRRRGLQVLLAGCVVWCAALFAEGVTGSLIFARFALPVMAVGVVVVAVAVPGAARMLAQGRPARFAPAAGVMMAVLLAVQVPFVVDARRTTAREHHHYSLARSALRPGVPCMPIATPNTNFRAFAAVWTDARMSQVVDAARQGVPPVGTFVTATGPSTRALLRDPAFPQLLAFPPADPVRTVSDRHGSWIVTSRCDR